MPNEQVLLMLKFVANVPIKPKTRGIKKDMQTQKRNLEKMNKCSICGKKIEAIICKDCYNEIMEEFYAMEELVRTED